MNNLRRKRQKSPKWYRYSGFALVEVLLAAVVLSVGVLAFMKLQNISLQTGFNSYARTQGLATIESFIASLRTNTHFSNLPTRQTNDFILGGTVEANPPPQYHSICQTNTNATACASVSFDYQRYLISQQMQTALPDKNSLLCYQQDGHGKGFIRVDFLWLDSSTKAKNQTLSGNDCPRTFQSSNKEAHKNHQITIYAQL